MKRIVLSLLSFLPLAVMAQNDASALLDRIVEGMKADAALQQNYIYTVYDEADAVVYSDKGVLKLENECYALDMENLKVWCDGTTQWSYMKDIDEIYITEADSEEAQNLSPLYIMEHYRKDCDASLTDKGDKSLVILKIDDEENDIERVELYISKKETQLVAMLIYMPGQGYIEVLLDGYTPNCGVGDDAFVCPEDDFLSAEVIDMR